MWKFLIKKELLQTLSSAKENSMDHLAGESEHIMAESRQKVSYFVSLIKNNFFLRLKAHELIDQKSVKTCLNSYYFSCLLKI